MFDGTRVSKADARVDAYGDVDELNAWLGLVRAAGPVGAPQPELAGLSGLDEGLTHIQRDLFALGAMLADPRHRIADRVEKATLGDADVARLEALIDRLEASVPPLRHFILPSGSPCGAAVHVARTVCRRAERRVVALTPPPDPLAVRYLNRLSDLLFVLARAVNLRAGAPETQW